MNVKGRELYQKMVEDRMAPVRGEPGAPKYGLQYYDKLADAFGPSESPAKQLRVRDAQQVIGEELINSFSEIHTVPKSYDSALIFVCVRVGN